MTEGNRPATSFVLLVWKYHEYIYIFYSEQEARSAGGELRWGVARYLYRVAINHRFLLVNLPLSAKGHLPPLLRSQNWSASD